MAIESPYIRVAIIEANEFPDLVHRYRITGVPKTVVNDQIEILGAQPEDRYVRQIVSVAAA